MNRTNIIAFALKKKKPNNTYEVAEGGIKSNGKFAKLIETDGDKITKGVKCESLSLVFVFEYGVYYNDGSKGFANLQNSVLILDWNTYMDAVIEYIHFGEGVLPEVTLLVKEQQAILGMVTKIRDMTK